MEKQGGRDAKNTRVILPFVQGGLTGLFASTLSWLGCSLIQCFPHHGLPRQYIAAVDLYQKRFPAILLVTSTSTAFRFGSFEILKQLLEAANHGRPLSLYQEASCGVAAGAMGSIFGCPVYLAHHRIKANANLMSGQQTYFRHLMLDLCHTAMDKGFLAIYRGGSLYTAYVIGFNTGMFASYGRSVNYFKESWGFNKSDSQISAALVSGFFASACSLPCINLAHAIRAVQNNDKLQCKSFFDYTIKSFKICGHTIFWKGFMTHLSRTAIPVAATWIWFEKIGGCISESTLNENFTIKFDGLL